MKELNNIKIVQYSPKYKCLINNFINECMFTFINRPYKKRKDVLNIEEYYFYNNGNFWIALDDDEIIGSIALENRGRIGILKRFYVNSDYQNLGIGTLLYNTFEKYVINETNIHTLYLACGKILSRAHKFYKKNGWIQIQKLEVEMHVANDDDFFKKEYLNTKKYKDNV